jgi:soluble lytic murein transglycosylase-like protein
MVNGAKGFRLAIRTERHDAVPAAHGCVLNQRPQDIRIDLRHVAGDNEVPLRPILQERGIDAACGTARSNGVRNNGIAQVAVTGWVGDDVDRIGDLRYGSREKASQRLAQIGQQSFVPAHAAALTAGQHESGKPHERIVSLRPKKSGYKRSPGVGNKKMYFCLVLFGMTAFMTTQTCLAANVSVVHADLRTGRLVRSVVFAQPAPNPQPSPQLSELAEAAARTYDVSLDLVNSVIQVESNYNSRAVSPKGAQGIMQLMPETAARFGVRNSFDPKENIDGGVRYLKFLQDLFKDDLLAAAAYNAGEGAVTKYGGVPPYKETIDYVARVGKKLGEAKRVKAAAQKPKATVEIADEKVAEEKHPQLKQFVDEEGRVHLIAQ